MRFGTRVFLASSAVGAAGVVVAVGLVYVSAEHLHRQQYELLNQERLTNVALDFSALERAYDRVAANAARVVHERIARGAKAPSQNELAALAAELGVWKISVAGSAGDATARQTPLVIDKEDGEVARFTMVPTADRRGLITVGVHYSELGAMLQQLADDESDIDYVALRAPDGKVLGEALNRKRAMTEAWLPTRGAEYRARVPAVGESQGYELVGRATLRSFERSIGELRARFAAVFAFVLALSLGVSYWVSRALASRVGRLRAAMDDIMATRDYARQLPTGADGRAADEIDALAGHFNQLSDRMREAQKTEARAAVAAQVAHDIRSPLTAMVLALNQLQTALGRDERTRAAVSEMLSALSNGVSRVGGIVSRLSGKDKAAASAAVPINVEAPRLTLVDKLLFDVAQEHLLKLRGSPKLTISGLEPVPGIWAVVQVTELQAAVSNILNNACEAVDPRTGEVELACAVEGRQLRVRVRDNGVGMPPEVLARAFEREFTSGKKGGSGLGLFQAKKAIEWAGGRIELESKPGAGTTVSFTIPVEKTPLWAVDELALERGETLVAADDDPAVLAVWRRKAEGVGVAYREFASITALEQALPSLGGGQGCRFVLDQYAAEGGREGVTGLKLIETHGLGSRSWLSTSEFDDPTIQARVKALGAKLIPKPRLAAARLIIKN